MIAKHWVRSPKADLAKLNLMVKRTRPGHEGLPESARRSLAAFRDLGNVRAFLALPDAIFAREEKEKLPSKHAAHRVAAALWMKIAQRAPLRIDNLLHTDVHANVLRSHAGKGASVALFYPPDQVKNAKALEVPLPPVAVARLARPASTGPRQLSSNVLRQPPHRTPCRRSAKNLRSGGPSFPMRSRPSYGTTSKAP
jgi:hypothetical protein